MNNTLTSNKQYEEKLPWYEKLHQNRFEDIVINSLKEKFILSTRHAVHKYEEICGEVNIHDERCKLHDNVYSLRKYIIERLKELGIDLMEEDDE